MTRLKILWTLALPLSAILLGAAFTSASFAPATSTPRPTTPLPPATPLSRLPTITVKQKPQEITFNNPCPPEGEGGDSESNLLKNRVDQAQTYLPVRFDAVKKLPWPPGIENRDREKWTITDTRNIQHYEGLPIAVQGYLWGVEPNDSGEATNCGAKSPALIDWHIWLIQSPPVAVTNTVHLLERAEAIVVETTPRVRKDHPGWTLPRVRQIVKDRLPVRISGWLFLDPEHPEELPKKKGDKATRGTIWEIHPIMKIEVFQGGQWVSLDSLPIK